MVANKHIPKIIVAVMAVAVILCFLAVGFSQDLTQILGGTSVNMEYETKLFDTDEVIEIIGTAGTTPGVTVVPSAVSIGVGESFQLSGLTIPRGKEIVWTSSDEEKATVSGGVVTGVGAGSATITATATFDGDLDGDDDTYTDTCTVTVS